MTRHLHSPRIHIYLVQLKQADNEFINTHVPKHLAWHAHAMMPLTLELHDFEV